jgi:hypothetical protein
LWWGRRGEAEEQRKTVSLMGKRKRKEDERRKRKERGQLKMIE